MLRLWNWLKRLFNRLFGKKRQPPQPDRPPPAPEPDDAQCEAVFMELLEGVDQGWTRGNGKSFLIGKNISEARMTAWLREFAERVGQNPEQHRELGRRLQNLGNLAWGELSPVAARLARELVVVEEPRAQGREAEVDGDGLGTEEEEKKKIELILLRQYQQGDFLGCITSFDKLLEIEPDNHDFWLYKGELWGKLGRKEEEIASYDRALEIKPDFHNAWNKRGIVLCDHLSRYEEAIASWDRALEIKPDDHQAWYNRGVALYALGRNEEAIASYDRALEIKPDDHQAWNGRGVALGELGRTEEAIASYDRALEIKPDDPQAWYNRGVALGELGRTEEAIASFDQALEIKPDFHQAWLNRGTAAGNSSYSAPLQPSTLTLQYPQLNQRGFEGKLASYHLGLTFCTQDQNPQGWGRLHWVIGRAYYYQGRKSLYPPDAGRSDFHEALNHYHQALQTLTREAYPENCLELIQDLIKVHSALGNKGEKEAWRDQGFKVWDRLMSGKTSAEKRPLELKFIRFSRMDVDRLLEQNQPIQAFERAEHQKNIYLEKLLNPEQSTDPTTPYIQQNLLNPTTALILWHLSDLNLTTFLLLPDASAPIPFTTSPEPLQRWFHNWETTYQQHRKTKQNTHSTWRETLDEQLQQLQQLLNIDQICDRIRAHLPEPVGAKGPSPLQPNTSKTDINTLILIPHLDLHRLPLHTLFPDTFTLTTLPSAQVGIQKASSPSLKAPSPVGEGVGGEGNSPVQEGPTLLTEPPRNSLEDLPLAELEAQVIAYLCHPSHRIPSDNATLDTLKEHLAQPYHRFHFTGHASHDFKAPQDSRLVLTDDETLTLRDLIHPDFHLAPFALVSLSACETAVTSREAFDDDYVGLVSAFLSRGTRQVLSTLWTVESRSNALFMIEFYRQLTQERKTTTQAFHHTQHWLKHLTPSQLVTWYHQLGQTFLTEGETIEEDNRRRRVMLQGKDLQQKSEVLQEAIKEGELSPHDSLYSHPYYWAAFTLTHGNE
jgi:CHAT domain-containing protein/tetratricopeptide (TPR) repeat protein